MPLDVEKVGSDKYQKIIQAATKVFSNKGFYNSKVSDVAKEAQVADGTIYLYFKNKDDLLISIFEYSMDIFTTSILDKMKEAEGPVEKLKQFIRLHLDLVRKNQDTAQVLQIELRQSSKFMKEYAADKFRDYLNLIEMILEEGKEKGVFRADLNSVIVKRAIFGAIDEMALDWVLMKRKKYKMQEVEDQLCNLLIEGIEIKRSHEALQEKRA